MLYRPGRIDLRWWVIGGLWNEGEVGSMALKGTYGFAYSGTNGMGIGVLEITNDGTVVGRDLGGGRYGGKAVEEPNTGEIRLQLILYAPAGMDLVQGTAAQNRRAPWSGSYTSRRSSGTAER